MISSSERAADGCVRYSADVPVHVTIFLATLLLCCVSRGQTRVDFGATAKLADNGQLLRVPRSFAKAEKRAIFWKALEANPGAFSELALFTRWSDEARPVDFHRKAIKDVRDFMADAHARGYVAGVNVLPTVAFPEDYAVQHVAGARNRVTEKGVEQRGTLCLRSPVTLKLVHDLCALYASAGVDFVYLDDDVDLAHCYCPDCLRRFAELSGCAVTGAADVCAARNAADPDVRRRARNAWIDLADESRAAFFSAAAKGAHSVSPKVGVGCMTCAAAISDRAGKLWSEALAGEAKTPVRWRPGGGCWSDQSKGEMLAKLENIVQQIRGVPASAEVQAELECFPYHGLQKTPGFIGYEAMLYVAWGCDAVAFNLFGGDPEALADEFRGSLERAAAVAPTLRDLRRTFGERPAEGVAYPWGRFALTDVSRDWSDWGLAPRPTAFACIGLPIASDPAAAQVLLVDEAAARGLSPSALTNALSGGVYLDAAALTALTERGFGDLVGFAISNDAPRTAGFRDLDHPLNLPGYRKRRIRYSLNGGRESRVPLLVRRSDKAEFTSESVLSAFADERCGYNGGVFENALGGRVAVCTQLPFVECEGLPRAEHLKRTLRWLSKDSLPGYVKSFHRVLFRARGDVFFAANVACEELRNVEFALRTKDEVDCTVWEGGLVRERLTLRPVSADGAYSIYRLQRLPNLGEVLLGKRVRTH